MVMIKLVQEIMEGTAVAYYIQFEIFNSLD